MTKQKKGRKLSVTNKNYYYNKIIIIKQSVAITRNFIILCYLREIQFINIQLIPR